MDKGVCPYCRVITLVRDGHLVPHLDKKALCRGSHEKPRDVRR